MLTERERQQIMIARSQALNGLQPMPTFLSTVLIVLGAIVGTTAAAMAVLAAATWLVS